MSGDGEDHDLDPDIAPEGPTLDERTAALRERYEAWRGPRPSPPQPSLSEVSELFRTLVSVDIDPASKAEDAVKAQAVVVAGLDYCSRYLRSLARDLPA